MIHSPQHQEYSARYGLKNASDNIEAAQQIAEAKYRSLVGREIFISEISGIHQLIDELRNWTNGSMAGSTQQSNGTH
jgi:hypothetical protein